MSYDTNPRPHELPTGGRQAAARLWKTRGLMLIIPAICILLYCLIAGFRVYGMMHMSHYYPAILPLEVVGLIIGLVGWNWYMRGKCYSAAYGEDLLLSDPRAPVVYLRPFYSDEQAARKSKILFSPSEEEQLALAMNEIGPFVAIGKPGEPAPQLGAARVYLEDQDWKRKVASWVSNAQLVLIRLGLTEGLSWELSHVTASTAPERLILLLPWGGWNGYETFRESMSTHFPRGLPELPKSKWQPASTLYGIVYFEPDWAPHFQLLKRPFYLNPVLKLALGFFYVCQAIGDRYWLTPYFKRSMQTPLSRLGLAWKKKPSFPAFRPLLVASLFVGTFASLQLYDELRFDKYNRERNALVLGYRSVISKDLNLSFMHGYLSGKRNILERQSAAEFQKDGWTRAEYLSRYQAESKEYNALVESRACAYKSLMERTNEFNREVHRLGYEDLEIAEFGPKFGPLERMPITVNTPKRKFPNNVRTKKRN